MLFSSSYASHLRSVSLQCHAVRVPGASTWFCTVPKLVSRPSRPGTSETAGPPPSGALSVASVLWLPTSTWPLTVSKVEAPCSASTWSSRRESVAGRSRSSTIQYE